MVAEGDPDIHGQLHSQTEVGTTTLKIGLTNKVDWEPVMITDTIVSVVLASQQT